MGFLQRVGSSLIATNLFGRMSTDTQNMLKLAVRGEASKEIEQALDWHSKEFEATHFFIFLSALR